jgi:hypothetical protein
LSCTVCKQPGFFSEQQMEVYNEQSRSSFEDEEHDTGEDADDERAALAEENVLSVAEDSSEAEESNGYPGGEVCEVEPTTVSGEHLGVGESVEPPVAPTVAATAAPSVEPPGGINATLGKAVDTAGLPSNAPAQDSAAAPHTAGAAFGTAMAKVPWVVKSFRCPPLCVLDG